MTQFVPNSDTRTRDVCLYFEGLGRLSCMARTVKSREIPSGTLRLKKEKIDPRNSAHYGVSSDTAWYVEFPDGDRSMYYPTRTEAEGEFDRIYNFRGGDSGNGGGLFGGDGLF